MKIYFPNTEDKYSFWFDKIFLKRYWTSAKIRNYLKAERARKKRSIYLSHYPFAAYIDPTNVCPLHCPLCPTGLRKQGRANGMMSFEQAREIIDEIGKYLFFIRFYNWGEPFLNKDIFKMFEYGKNNNIGSATSSNFSTINNDTVRRIIDSPLDYLIVSLDGVSQSVYEKYRRGGDVKKTLFYLSKLAELKKKKRNKNLIIEWLYVLNRYNVCEVEKAIETAEKIGVDVLHFSPICDSLSLVEMDKSGERTYSDFKQDAYQSKKRREEIPKTCSWLYNRIVFNWDGSVSPCCAVDSKKHDFTTPTVRGPTSHSWPIKDVWNNQKYQSARSFFKTGRATVPIVCSKCLFFKKNSK